MDKPLSEMTTEEVLAEIARFRERRAVNRANQARPAAGGAKPRAPKSGGRKPSIDEISDDLEALLG